MDDDTDVIPPECWYGCPPHNMRFDQHEGKVMVWRCNKGCGYEEKRPMPEKVAGTVYSPARAAASKRANARRKAMKAGMQ